MRLKERFHILFHKPVTISHVVQSLLAGTYILFVFLLMNSFRGRLAVASLGASTFIAFSFPRAQSSRPRFLIGGYAVGIAGGLLCGKLIVPLQAFFPHAAHIPACALAVFISMLVMTIMDFEHPPSAALAIAVTLDPNPLLMSFLGMLCILLLCAVKELLKKYLNNL